MFYSDSTWHTFLCVDTMALFKSQVIFGMALFSRPIAKTNIPLSYLCAIYTHSPLLVSYRSRVRDRFAPIVSSHSHTLAAIMEIVAQRTAASSGALWGNLSQLKHPLCLEKRKAIEWHLRGSAPPNGDPPPFGIYNEWVDIGYMWEIGYWVTVVKKWQKKVRNIGHMGEKEKDLMYLGRPPQPPNSPPTI